jgi:hypothetical protein
VRHQAELAVAGRIACRRPVVGLAAANPQVNLLQATATGCKPVMDGTGQRQCLDLMRFLFTDSIPRHRFDMIVISSRWSAGTIDSLAQTARALKPFAERLVVLGSRVEYKQDLPWLLAASMLQHDTSVVDRSRVNKQKRLDRLFADRLRAEGVTYISLYDAICPAGRCQVTDQDGLPLAFDYGHLTASGSMLVAQRIKQAGGL